MVKNSGWFRPGPGLGSWKRSAPRSSRSPSQRPDVACRQFLLMPWTCFVITSIRTWVRNRHRRSWRGSGVVPCAHAYSERNGGSLASPSDGPASGCATYVTRDRCGRQGSEPQLRNRCSEEDIRRASPHFATSRRIATGPHDCRRTRCLGWLNPTTPAMLRDERAMRASDAGPLASANPLARDDEQSQRDSNPCRHLERASRFVASRPALSC